jgi:hypothetical protein
MSQHTTRERRRVPRFPFHARATLRIEDAEFEGLMLDISYQGALFGGPSGIPASRDDDCLLLVCNNGTRTLPLTVPGRVAFAENGMVGVSFHPLEHNVLRGLMEIIELNLGVPSLLERNLETLVGQTSQSSITE